MLVYPQYVISVARDGEGGDDGDFWKCIRNYFAGGQGGGSRIRNAIPPSAMETKLPDKEIEKLSTPNKEENFQEKPSKPFYYVLPPNSGLQYIPGIFPKFNVNNPFLATLNTKSTIDVLTPQKKENVQIIGDVKPIDIEPKERN